VSKSISPLTRIKERLPSSTTSAEYGMGNAGTFRETGGDR
jgi:hypothetical protein